MNRCDPKAKSSAVDSTQKLLDIQSKAKCENSKRELITTKEHLDDILLSSTDKVKDANIESLSSELDFTKSKLIDAKEGVLTVLSAAYVLPLLIAPHCKHDWELLIDICSFRITDIGNIAIGWDVVDDKLIHPSKIY